MNAEGNADAAEIRQQTEMPRVEAAVRSALGDVLVGREASRQFLNAALLGRGIGASRTPGMHEAEGARLGFRYVYKLIDFDQLALADADLPAAVDVARTVGLNGVNVTHPFKEAVVRCVDELSPDAAAIGAVNTLVFSDNRVTGHNTDSYGFTESFRRGLVGAPLDRVVLFGAGGGGMAVAHALLKLGVSRLRIADRIEEKALSLARNLSRRFPGRDVAAASDIGFAVRTASGVVNATPSGMSKYPGSPFDKAFLRPELWVADIVYFPAETELIRAARAAGCRTLGGSSMAVFQAVLAFELISGLRADPEQMAHHFGLAPAE